MMTIAALRHSIAELPARSRTALATSILREEIKRLNHQTVENLSSLLEDLIDMKRHLRLLEKGKFLPWKEVKGKLDAHYGRSLKKRS